MTNVAANYLGATTNASTALIGYKAGMSGGSTAVANPSKNTDAGKNNSFFATYAGDAPLNLFYIGAIAGQLNGNDTEGTLGSLKGSADNSIEVVNVKFYLEGMNATQAHDAYKATTSEFGLNLD